jgi:uncharacterized protein YfaS (alpha-2-macroglobulin family)
MKKTLSLLLLASGLGGSLACGGGSGGTSGTAPVISNLDLPSPLKAGVATTGTVEVQDSQGLDNLSIDFTFTATSGESTSFTAPVSGSDMITDARVDFVVELGPTTPSGKYAVSVTVSDGTNKSEPLSTSVMVE